MSRLFSTISDAAAYFKKTTHVTPVKYAIELAALGAFARNQYMGGHDDDPVGIDCQSTGDKDLHPVSLPFLIDNTSSQISGSASIVVQVRFSLRVSDASISLTPKILKSTDGLTWSAATYSGASAATGTATDFSGTNQKQTLSLTLDAAVRYYKAQVTVAGSVATGFMGWASALFDCYCNV